ncbi:MAG: lipopolysaccharide biosynthesis protein [Nitrospira sp.]|nr:MAG: lipopolysaccharide biosynthesis protein [Nitrospira sp.]
MAITSNNAEAAITPGIVPPPAKSSQQLDRSLVHSIAWTGVIKWITQILAWVSTIVVARVLSPADYGLVAIASTFIGFVTMINEFGLGMAVVTKRDLEERQIAQLNTLAVLLGLAGFLVSCAVAIPLSRFFEASELTWVLVAMGASFLIGAFRTVPSALLEKELKFKLLAMVEGGQAIIASLCVVALALLGWGYWSLVVGMIMGTAAWTLFTLLYRTHAFRWPAFQYLTETLTFSWHLILMRVNWYVAANADRFIIGKILGQAALGSYSFACTLASVPIEKVTGLVNRVTPAFFSSMQSDYVSLRRYILNLTEGLALVTFPATTGLALVADDFVMVLLGDQWKEVVVPLQILACYGAFRSMMTLLSPILLVTGLSRLGMLNAFWCVAALLPAFYVGSRWGIIGVAVSWMVAHPFVTIPLYSKVFRHIGLPVGAYLRALWPAVSACLVMTTAVLLLKQMLPIDWPLLAHLVTLGIAGAVAYLLTAWIFHRARVMAFVELLRTLRS